jgi:RND family efflux transporter MFP subunit
VLNLSNLYINADVSEAYLTKVKKGDPVLVEFPSYPEISMEVPVYRTGNMVKPANRTFQVQLKINNENNMIKPNVLAKIKINDYTDMQALAIPSIIIKQDMKGSYVYIVDVNTGVARKSYIETGMAYQGMSEVVNGLNIDERVIVAGYNQISDGSPVRIAK